MQVVQRTIRFPHRQVFVAMGRAIERTDMVEREIPIFVLTDLNELSAEAIFKCLDGSSLLIRQMTAVRMYLYHHPSATWDELLNVAKAVIAKL